MQIVAVAAGSSSTAELAVVAAAGRPWTADSELAAAASEPLLSSLAGRASLHRHAAALAAAVVPVGCMWPGKHSPGKPGSSCRALRPVVETMPGSEEVAAAVALGAETFPAAEMVVGTAPTGQMTAAAAAVGRDCSWWAAVCGC